MQQFEVYPRYDVHLEKGRGCWLQDAEGKDYLDLYGGHAVISIGHAHPRYVERIKDQLDLLGFYSNSVQLDIQDQYAEQLAKDSGYTNYQLFLCNSGAEANENAMKLASFVTGRKKIVVFEKGFHGRTSLAVEATDNKKIQAPINMTGNVIRLPMNEASMLEQVMSDEIAAVIIEGIQGIAGIYVPDDSFLLEIRRLCDEHGSLMILDEIQSGFGRSGQFFAHQYAKVEADIISMAKGMGNGFPVGGVLIKQDIEAWYGMLGTTFGGNPLACAAGLAVLEVLQDEDLVNHSKVVGDYLIEGLNKIPEIKEVRGRGLMIGMELPIPIKSVREKLLMDHRIFTGSSSNPNTIRLLPPLTIGKTEADIFLNKFSEILADETVSEH